MEKKIKHIELTVNDVRNVKKISFVKEPAMESEDFMYFSKEYQEEFQKVDEKGIVTGLVMRADKVIPRVNKFTKEKYTVSFSKDAVLNSSIYFMKDKNTDKVNLEHKYDVEGVTMIESYIIQNEKINNAVALGFKDVKEGDWFGSFKIENEDLKKMVKNGDVTGFSIEGQFIDAILSNMEEKEFNKMRTEKFESIKTMSGSEIYIVGEIAVDTMVYDKLPTKMLINDEVSDVRYPVYAPIIELEDGRVLELENGKIVNIVTKEDNKTDKQFNKLIEFLSSNLSDIDLCLNKIEEIKKK